MATPYDGQVAGLGGDLLGSSGNTPFQGLGMALMPDPIAGAVPNDPNSGINTAQRLTPENVDLMARVLTQECGRICNPAEMQGIGSTLINRMNRAGTDQVADVTGHAYAVADTASPAAMDMAMGLLSGNLGDNTGNATHFYSPMSMPKVGQPTGNYDVGGGVEQVPRPTKATGLARQLPVDWNYVPSWAGGLKQYPRNMVPGVRTGWQSSTPNRGPAV